MWGALRSYIANSRRRLQNFLADDPTIGISMEREQEREAMLGECREHVREIKAILQGDADLQTKESAVYKIVVLCRQVGKPCKDVLREEGVLEGLMTTVSQLEMRELSSDRPSGSYQETFVQALYRALGETVYDNVVNAEIAAHFGLLKIVEASLSRKSEDDVLTEPILTVVNNIIGMSQSTHALLQEAGIVPLLVRFVGCQTSTNDNGRQIATAALANLSNNALMREQMIRSGAVEVLATALLQFPPEAEVEVPLPSVSYMQSLSAVVKIVGGGAMMGTVGGHGEREEGAITFNVNGSRSTRVYDERTNQLVLDRRSVRWMLAYLDASMSDDPYPPDTNIYGTPWKVALSISCIARGSALNREMLRAAGVWTLLARAATDLDIQQHADVRRGGRREEQEATGEKVVMAMRSMLRSEEDVQHSREELQNNPDAKRVLEQLLGLASNAALPTKSRHAAAEVLCMWGCG